jgi:hypothetical protein
MYWRRNAKNTEDLEALSGDQLLLWRLGWMIKSYVKLDRVHGNDSFLLKFG